MNHIYQELEALNNNAQTRNIVKLQYILLGIVLVSILLFFVPNVSVAIPVLLLFFSVIILMITLFVKLIQYAAKIQVFQRNTVKTVYRHHVENANSLNQTDYEISPDTEKNVEVELFPSYARHNVQYTIKSPTSELNAYYSDVAIPGKDGATTRIFTGLYLTMPIISNQTFLYTQYSGTGEKLSSAFSKLNISKDTNPFSSLHNSKKYEKGTIAFNKSADVPDIMKVLITSLNKDFPTSTFKIGIHNNILQVSMSDKSIVFKAIKKYSKKEYESSKEVVRNDILLIQNVLNATIYS